MLSNVKPLSKGSKVLLVNSPVLEEEFVGIDQLDELLRGLLLESVPTTTGRRRDDELQLLL